MSSHHSRVDREARWRASREALRAFYEWGKSKEPVAGLALRLGNLMPANPQTPEELTRAAELSDIITSIYETDRSLQGIRDAVLSHVRQWRPDG